MSPASLRPSLQAANATSFRESVRSRRDFEERIDETGNGEQTYAPLASSFAPVIVSWPNAISEDHTTSGPSDVKTLVTFKIAAVVNGATRTPVAPHCGMPVALNF